MDRLLTFTLSVIFFGLTLPLPSEAETTINYLDTVCVANTIARCAITGPDDICTTLGATAVSDQVESNGPWCKFGNSNKVLRSDVLNKQLDYCAAIAPTNSKCAVTIQVPDSKDFAAAVAAAYKQHDCNVSKLIKAISPTTTFTDSKGATINPCADPKK